MLVSYLNKKSKLDIRHVKVSFIKVNVQYIHSATSNNSVTRNLIFGISIDGVDSSNVFQACDTSHRMFIDDLNDASIRSTDHDVIFAKILSTCQVMRIVRISLHFIQN